MDILNFAKREEEYILLVSDSITSRELTKNEEILTLIVNGKKIKENLPWLYDLYRGTFYEIAKKSTKLNLVVAKNPLYAINFNIQRGIDMRYECHVDSNPVQGLLYVTSHKEGEGGELVVSNVDGVFGIDDIKKDCTIIYPTSGDLVFFDARKHPHYVEPLKEESHFRIAVTMNFYTDESPETQRPKDLNEHLFKTKKNKK
jgi:hypothetical protein